MTTISPASSTKERLRGPKQCSTAVRSGINPRRPRPMTTRKQNLGCALGPDLAKIVEPKEIFVGSNSGKLYNLEEKRNAAITACANAWAKANSVDPDELWT